MSETNFAILIGMNNYSENELPFSVKDVDDLEKVLISRCRFDKDNIFKITNSFKPVKEQIDESFAIIEERFKKNRDTLLFYFSGHGLYDSDEAKSKIIFEDDTNLSIDDILIRYYPNKISPKNSYILIDACHSGSEIFFKNNNAEKNIRRLNYNSSETCMMFATESKKQAIQDSNIQNSYFTYYIIEAILKDSLYDEDGYLTIQVIDNYLKKKVVEKSSLLQIPVSEIRSSGYRIFSYNENFISSKSNSKKKPLKNDKLLISTEDSPIAMPFEKSLSNDNRVIHYSKYKKIIDEILDDFKGHNELNEYDIKIENPFTNMSYNHQQEIYRKIIENSKKDNLEAIEELFEKERLESKNNPWETGLASILSSLHQETKPQFRYKIYLSEDNLYCSGVSINSNSIYQTSCGLGIMLYQAKYGIVVGLIDYNLDWGGKNENKLQFINVKLKPYQLTMDNSNDVYQLIHDKVSKLPIDVVYLSENRKKEIEDFLKMT